MPSYRFESGGHAYTVDADSPGQAVIKVLQEQAPDSLGYLIRITELDEAGKPKPRTTRYQSSRGACKLAGMPIEER